MLDNIEIIKKIERVEDTIYGSLKNAKVAYQKIYGDRKYGRSWSEFMAVAKQLADSQLPQEELSLEARINKIEAFLQTLGYEP